MKEPGIVRRIDDLGRVVIPKSARKDMGVTEGDPLEIYIMGKCVFMRKYQEDGTKKESEMSDEALRRLINATNTLQSRLDLYRTVRTKGKDKGYESSLLITVLDAVQYIANGNWHDG